MNRHPGGIYKGVSHATRLNELRRKSGMPGLLASRLTQLPGQSMYHKHAERFTDSIIKRAQKKPAYAKPILELTPEDIADATTLYVVKPRVVGKKSTDTYVDGHGVEKNVYGNNVYYLPDSESHKYRRRLDVGKDYYFKHYSGTPNKTELLIQIVGHAIQVEGPMVSVYYVMNATNEAEAVRCITDYAMSTDTDIFKKVKVEDIRSKYSGGTTKRRRQRQIKKRKTVSKKMDINIFSKHIS
jgi:hypothetical protein